MTVKNPQYLKGGYIARGDAGTEAEHNKLPGQVDREEFCTVSKYKYMLTMDGNSSTW